MSLMFPKSSITICVNQKNWLNIFSNNIHTFFLSNLFSTWLSNKKLIDEIKNWRVFCPIPSSSVFVCVTIAPGRSGVARGGFGFGAFAVEYKFHSSCTGERWKTIVVRDEIVLTRKHDNGYELWLWYMCAYVLWSRHGQGHFECLLRISS